MEHDSFEEYMINDFKLFYPTGSSEVVKYERFDNNQIMVYLDNGDQILYDFVDKTSRMIRPEKRELTEERFRFEFSQRLIEKMDVKCWGQATLSEKTGISQGTISRYISGTMLPSLFNALKLAKALNCDVSELLRFPQEYQ